MNRNTGFSIVWLATVGTLLGLVALGVDLNAAASTAFGVMFFAHVSAALFLPGGGRAGD